MSTIEAVAGKDLKKDALSTHGRCELKHTILQCYNVRIAIIGVIMIVVLVRWSSAIQLSLSKKPLWRCGLREVCMVSLWLPLGALIFCFVSASIFQQDDIHETHCRVYNIIPSISAITGISPQRYLWRICVALHLGPRFLIGSLYHTYHMQQLNVISPPESRAKAKKLGEACYWLNLVEVCALTGVTYVSNRENYPVHEKIFIIFMVSSLLHMWCRATVGKMVQEGEKPLNGNQTVWLLFYISIASTLGLVVFFLRHRYLCRPMAFSWFSLCEYILASANMAFHATVIQDFPNHQIQVAHHGDHGKKE